MKRLSKSQIPTHKKKLVEEQNGKCAICEIDLSSVPTRDICLDHCHRNGHVRAALCRNCNGIEGKIYNLATRGKRGRSPSDFLTRILAYWDKHSDPENPIYHPDHKTEDEKREARNKKARVKRARAKAIKNIKGK